MAGGRKTLGSWQYQRMEIENKIPFKNTQKINNHHIDRHCPTNVTKPKFLED